MTFNTTRLPLIRALADKRLLVREPLKPLGEQRRWLLVDPQMDALLDGHILYGLFPQPSSERLIGRFCAGYLVTVSRKKTRTRPDIEQIVGSDQVWALCPREPKPGWRLLGRFCDPGVFVVLRAWDKRALFNNYARAAQEVIEDWEALFGKMRPYEGGDIENYVTGVFKDADEKP